jgi:hypothetical protein
MYGFARTNEGGQRRYHLAEIDERGPRIVCGIPANDAEVVPSVVVGVSCDTCANIAKEKQLPVTVQLESLPIEIRLYNNPIAASREQDQARKQERQRLFRLENLFTASSQVRDG